MADAGRAWRGVDLVSTDWTVEVPAFLAVAVDVAAGDRSWTVDLEPEPSLRDLGADLVADIRRRLDDDLGFVVLRGMPLGDGSVDAIRARYWLLGSLVAPPIAQDMAGTLVFDVRDEGGDVTAGARFAVTRDSASFHTDRAFEAVPPHYLGLVCVRSAVDGGLSQLVSGHAVRAALAAEAPEALARLQHPYCHDRRGGVPQDEAPWSEYPVVAGEDDRLRIRYLRYYIEAGHERAKRPLTTADVATLDALDEVLGREDLRVEFRLDRGDVLLNHNGWVLHNRTPYVDHGDPALRRHLLRLWLGSPLVEN